MYFCLTKLIMARFLALVSTGATPKESSAARISEKGTLAGYFGADLQIIDVPLVISYNHKITFAW